MNELIKQLLHFGNFDQHQIEIIKSKAKIISLKKGQYFSEAGKVFSKIGFLTDGILRVCCFDVSGKDVTKYFITENHFAADINSFRLQTKSFLYFEALTDCTLVVFSYPDFIRLSVAVEGWNNTFINIISSYLTHKLQLSRDMIELDAKSKYLLFLEQFPGLANQIPLYHLASYLGITQSSLSRIRKSIF